MGQCNVSKNKNKLIYKNKETTNNIEMAESLIEFCASPRPVQ